MIAFELNKPLNHFFETALTYIDEEFRSCGKYLLEGDDIIALGYEHSLRMSFADRGLITAEGYEYWEQYMPAELPTYEEDSMESELFKYIYTLFRMWQEIPPYADEHMHRVLLRKLNQRLNYYNIRVLVPKEICEIYFVSERVTIERAIVVIMERDMNYQIAEVIHSDYEAGEKLRCLGRHHDSLPYYLNVLNKETPGTNLYTLTAYALGEVYHFENDLAKSAEMYMLCDASLVMDEDELYKRLGHALLDERLKEYGELVKTYYRGQMNLPYYTKHKVEVVAAGLEVGEMFGEYEDTCIEIGRKKYNAAR